VVGKQARNLVTETVMLDLLMLALTMLFFGLAVAYVVGCERLE
jgi:hypothetical protein